MSDGAFHGFLLTAATILLAMIGIPGPSAFISTPALRSGVHLRADHTSHRPFATEIPSKASSSFLATCSIGSMLLVAGAVVVKRGAVVRHVNAPKKMKLESIPHPEKLLESPKFPKFVGSSEGYLSSACKERHAVAWVAPADRTFEMPTGGFAVMNKGDNLIYFRRKEQAICLTKELRKIKISDIKIYRIKGDGTVIFMHPLDGLWPENQTSGRPLVNWRPFSAYQNANQFCFKFTKYNLKAYEVDPLANMFARAKVHAFQDQENIYPMKNPDGWRFIDDEAEYKKKLQDAINSLPDNMKKR